MTWTRRHTVTAFTAALGLGAFGAGAWWRSARDGGTLSAGTDPALAELWAARYATPAGGELALGPLQGKPLLVNFWAPWCAPCVKEMPDLDRFAREFGARGWQVVGLAIDSADAVKTFLGRQPVRFPIGIAGLEALGLIRRLGNPNGGLPFSLALAAHGSVMQRKLGATDYPELVEWAKS